MISFGLLVLSGASLVMSKHYDENWLMLVLIGAVAIIPVVLTTLQFLEFFDCSVNAEEVDDLIKRAKHNGISHERFIEISGAVISKSCNVNTFMTYQEYQDIKRSIEKELAQMSKKDRIEELRKAVAAA